MVRVEALGKVGFARLKRTYSALRQLSIPATAAAGLPALWAGDQLLAVAGLSAAEPDLLGPAGKDGQLMLEARFAPQHVRAIMGPQGQDDT